MESKIVMEPEGLEQRLRRLEDIEEIKKLKARYCEACDRGWDGRASHDLEKIVALFTEDAVWDGGVYGRREGRSATSFSFLGISCCDPGGGIQTAPSCDLQG
jgi:hypothetical protein